MTSISLRRWHAYVGLFSAPTVLFLAFTGMFQVFNLHEAHGSYQPPVLLAELSAVHKDQVFEAPHAKPHPARPPSAMARHAAPDHDGNPKILTLALKCFFLIVALGLMFTTSVGIWMGLTQTRRTTLAWSLLAAGAVIPVLLLVLAA